MLRQFCTDIIKIGRNHLVAETGVVAEICKKRYTIVAISPKTSIFVEGDSYDIHNTICQKVIKCKKTIALMPPLSALSTSNHPLYHPLTMRTFIGTPILVDDKIWGLLEFTSFTPRKKPFTPEEVEFTENCAVKIADVLQKLRSQSIKHSLLPATNCNGQFI